MEENEDKVLTYNTKSFSIENHSLDEIVNTMAKSEVKQYGVLGIKIDTYALNFVSKYDIKDFEDKVVKSINF